MALHDDDQYSDRELHRLVRKLDGFCFGNGKPPLEDRIMVKVKEITEHQKNNYQQADKGILAVLEEDKRQRERAEEARQHQHDQNVSLLKWIIGLLVSGGLTAIGLLIAVLKTGR